MSDSGTKAAENKLFSSLNEWRNSIDCINSRVSPAVNVHNVHLFKTAAAERPSDCRRWTFTFGSTYRDASQALTYTCNDTICAFFFFTPLLVPVLQYLSCVTFHFTLCSTVADHRLRTSTNTFTFIVSAAVGFIFKQNTFIIGMATH